jgi:hypothetical protein
MKHFFVVAILTILSLTTFANKWEHSLIYQLPPNDSLIALFLNSLDLNYYKNKPVDTLLSNIPYPLQEISHRKAYHNCRLKESLLIFSDKVAIRLSIKNFQYINPINCNGAYNNTLFRKEKIGIMELCIVN